ncbi:MAG: hypothetical protein WC455_24875 [Dehalococcoidia bacterium]|jgi:hypothetical protein
MTMVEEMAIGQKYIPEFGYTAPKRTRHVCESPAFMDHNLHRVGYFKGRYDSDGVPGWTMEAKCVNCGRRFPDSDMFLLEKDAEYKELAK